MSNVVKNVDNRGGTINQTTIRKYFVLKPKRWFQKTFQKKKYYQHLFSLFEKQLRKKIDVQKNNRKYIPEVFLELNDIKENLRYITQPMLFYKKDYNEISNIEFYYFNKFLESLKLDKKELIIKKNLQNPKTLNELKNNSRQLQDIFENFKQSIPNMGDKKIRNNIKKNLTKEQYGLFALSQALDLRFYSMIEKFERKFDLLNKKLILLTEKAGQGKTNLICDFVDQVVLKKSLFGLMFTGNEFNNLDKKAIEDVILKDVYGFEAPLITFDEFLDDIEYLCNQKNSTFTLVIDGLNENSNIEKFSQELYKFTESILERDFIRLIFTCRSEYFEERFQIFKNPSFKNDMIMMDNYMNRYHHQKKELPEYLEDRLLNSYFKFFEVNNTIFDKVRHQLSNDFLLLRIFCEVYGQKTNPNPPVEQVYDIYKDDLFKKYFEYKKEEIRSKTEYTLTDFQQLFKTILAYMIENNHYINIPFSVLSDVNIELLNYIIDEDIFFRKDLIKDESSVLANKEVLNFTFDEFRDYLLADYLSTSDIDLEDFIKSINADETSIEGIEKYLFFKSRKSQYREKLKFLEDLEYYDDLFLDNVFSVKDEDIQDEDVQKIKNLFIKKGKYSKYIIHFLMYRHHTKLYKKLNIETLFEILESLNNDQYKTLVNPKFKIEYDYITRSRNSHLLNLLKQLSEILDSRDFSKEYQLHNIFEFMFLLLGVEDKSVYGKCPYELIELLEKYIDKYPEEAKKILLKYQSIKIDKVKENIWNLLNYYSDKFIDFDKTFCQELYYKMLDENNVILKNTYQNILEKCYKKDTELFTEEQKSFFEELNREREERIQFFQDMANGKIDPEKLFKEIDV